MIKISAYIITKNEEKRLYFCLNALSKVADEIIMVDSGSTDKTLDIAKHFNVKCFYHKWISYAHQKNYAQNKCSYDWLLSVDADEVLSDSLIYELQKIKKNNPEYFVYNMKIIEMFPHFKKPRLGAFRYNIIRFYHKKWATMKANLLTEDRISLIQKTKIGQLSYPIYHYSFLTISHQINKLNHYTDNVIATAVKKKKHYSIFRLIFEFPRQFLIYYVKKREFLNGFYGFVISMNMAYFRFIKVAKYMERQKNEHS